MTPSDQTELRITDEQLEVVVRDIARYLDKGFPGNAAVRLRMFANEIKAAAEQRARIDEVKKLGETGFLSQWDTDRIVHQYEIELEQSLRKEQE